MNPELLISSIWEGLQCPHPLEDPLPPQQKTICKAYVLPNIPLLCDTSMILLSRRQYQGKGSSRSQERRQKALYPEAETAEPRDTPAAHTACLSSFTQATVPTSCSTANHCRPCSPLLYKQPKSSLPPGFTHVSPS